ncbi:MAG TPA: alpha/beta fold hydrolase [Cyclobacteriaceae bacterium]|nr:alpha/beta fold hydrolase [Cyclobacteriaceae bacterium]
MIVSHGLEGNSHRAYVKGMAKAFSENGFDVIAWNFRGCSGEMNKSLRFYHSGATDDLSFVVDHALSKSYRSVFLVGFSLGGNLTLKFAGEKPVDPRVKGIAVFSVPLNLYTSCIQISRKSNWIYSNRFLNHLKKKIKTKAKLMQGLDVTNIDHIKTLIDFDDRYTAPLHGFGSAIDYYTKCSAIHFLQGIQTPTLVVNAKNDPFLSPECFPQLVSNSVVKMEFPDRGGHVGFASFQRNGLYWSEQRALEFLEQLER